MAKEILRLNYPFHCSFSFPFFSPFLHSWLEISCLVEPNLRGRIHDHNNPPPQLSLPLPVSLSLPLLSLGPSNANPTKPKYDKKQRKGKKRHSINSSCPPPPEAESAISYHGILYYFILPYRLYLSKQTTRCLALRCAMPKIAQPHSPPPVILHTSVKHHEPTTNTIKKGGMKKAKHKVLRTKKNEKAKNRPDIFPDGCCRGGWVFRYLLFLLYIGGPLGPSSLDRVCTLCSRDGLGWAVRAWFWWS
ncbi:hypothetical protein HOY80DRAFT_954529 [Tuber brumale]|nr:hypothetical protein HOY80DRAFT_954529 [Tuber brumale]